VTPSDLRPLGIGEILDRAVTLFVRRFAVLALILAAVAIPVAIVQYAADPGQSDPAGLGADFQRILTLPAAAPQKQLAIFREIFPPAPLRARDIELALVSDILGVLSTTACVIGVAQTYAGKLPSVRAVYREALRRWPAQLAACVVFTAFILVVTAGVVIAIFFVSLPLLAIAAFVPRVATIIAVPGFLVGGLAFLGETALLNFVMQMVFVSIALEDAQPMRGIAHGLRRTLGRAVFWRSALAATTIFAVTSIGSLMLLSIAAGLSSLTHVAALSPIISAIGDIALSALVTAFSVIYALDVRVRREGYDLALAVQEAPL